MSNKSHKNKQNITKISAQSGPAKTDTKPSEPIANPATTKPQTNSAQAKTPSAVKVTKKSKSKDSEKPLREVFILFRPFVALGRYLRDSWREIRQVRWPNRKATWKMTLAVLIYCAIFFAFILLLDTFFTFIFNLLLGINN